MLPATRTSFVFSPLPASIPSVHHWFPASAQLEAVLQSRTDLGHAVASAPLFGSPTIHDGTAPRRIGGRIALFMLDP
jgi:hypothetical protein